MRCLRISFVALMTLAFASGANAQNPGPGKAQSDQMDRGVSLSSPPVAPNPPDFTASLQTELKRVGCFAGAIDGVWDGKTKAALADFVQRTKVDVPTDAPTSAAVESLKGRRDRVCPLDCGANRIERNGQCVAKVAPEKPPPARPQAVETKRAPREKSEDNSPSSGMCWRNDGRTTALVPCSEAPTGRRAY